MTTKIFTMVTAIMISVSVMAQKNREDKIRTTGFPVMKTVVNTDIPGAPLFSEPIRINGYKQEIRTEEHGLIYPTSYDWNHDGKPDLLLGDFVTGKTGSYIKVYLNEGSATKPKFSGKYFWATDIKGDILTNYQWCCIGIHPRIVDLDQDGYPDILSGQYNPGDISWWRGSRNGFMPRQFVPQDGDPHGNYDALNRDSPHCQEYWVYSSAGFGDFNGDGLEDLFVGGVTGMRVALNTGTKENPRFGIRKPLLFVDGTFVMLNGDALSYNYGYRHMKTYITPIDWDNDGVLDLLVTHDYAFKGDDPIVFFRGVNTNKGLRFEKPKPLFTAKDGSKLFPGCQPMISVVDWNGDGVKDLLIGMSIPTINGFEVCDTVAWNWIHSIGIEMPGKDAGEVCAEIGRDSLINIVTKRPVLKPYYMGKLSDYKYLTLRHRGYPFIMLGKRNPIQAKAVTVQASDPKPLPTEAFKDADSIVTYRVDMPDTIKGMGNFAVRVTLSIKDGWHGYTESEGNKALGMIPTKVEIQLPDWVNAYKNTELPAEVYGGATLYTGNNTFSRGFLYDTWRAKNKTELPVKILISYQVCNNQMCMPPKEYVIEKKIPIIELHKKK